jgi:hypothetical protein
MKIPEEKIKKVIQEITKEAESKKYNFEESMYLKEQEKKAIGKTFNIPFNKVDVEPTYFYRTLEEDKGLLEELKLKIHEKNLTKLK